MSRKVCVIEWVDKNGRVYRTPPVENPTDAYLKAGVRQALEAMCKPSLRELVETDEGYLIEP